MVITGGTGGLGLETAKRLALGGADIIITARSDDKGRAAVAEINEYLSAEFDDGVTESLGVKVSYRVLDLDNVRGIEDAVSEWASDETFPSRLDCLINNAGVMNLPKLELTGDGVERQMSSNHLGHFVLTKLLTPRLAKTARIINVSSSAHQFANGGLDFDYCWGGAPGYNGWRSYGQSKLANILFSQELQRRSNESGREWNVACLHPGVVSTDLWRQVVSAETYQSVRDLSNTIEDSLPDYIKEGLNNLAKKSGDLGIFKTVEQGATTSIWLAAGAYDDDNDGVRTNAGYYDNCKPQTLGDFARDEDAAQRLWRESEERAGITFNFEEDSALEMKASMTDEEEVEELKSPAKEKTVDEDETKDTGADDVSEGEMKDI